MWVLSASPWSIVLYRAWHSVLFEEICCTGFWCIMDGGRLGAVPCGKMEESWWGRAADADHFSLNPGALGISFMKRLACRSTVLCHASCYHLNELNAVYLHLLYVQRRAPSSDLQFSNALLMLLTSLSSRESESLLEEINQAVNNVKMSSRKPKEVSLRLFCKSVKKLITEYYWALLGRNLFNEHCLPWGQSSRATEESVLF